MALLSAMELGLFTELGKGPRSRRQVCRTLGLNELAAPRLLDALVELGFLEREGDGERAIYLNTREAAHFLDSNSPAYLGNALEQAAGKPYEIWRDLVSTLRAAGKRCPCCGRPES